MSNENYDPLFPDQPVVDLYLPIWSKLSAFKSKPAFIWVDDDDDDHSTTSFLTYSQLNSSVTSISSQLPLRRGETVVVLCSPGLELVEIIFACQRAGHVIVPIYPSLPEENYHHFARVLSQTNPKAAIAQRSYIAKVFEYISSRNDTKLAYMLSSLTWIATEDLKGKVKVNDGFDFSSYGGRRAEEEYLIQYSSGATGPPKPVMVAAGSAAHNARSARRAYDLHPGSVIASWLPQYHDCGLMFLLLTVVSGSTCVLASPMSFAKRPRVWLEMISAFGATCTPVPSFALSLAVKRGGGGGRESPMINLSSLRNLIIINEPIYESSVEEFVEVFRPFGLNPTSVSPSYGLAENCTFVSTSWRLDSCSTKLPCHNKLLPSARLGVVGDAEDDVEIVVVNEETLEPVEDGVEGEILVASPSNASGYLGHPSLSDAVFRSRSVGDKIDRFFVRTGDRGVVKGKERYLFVTGRCADVIKLRKKHNDDDDINKEIHAHYVETSAYKSCPRFLRGGCLAAFKVAEIVVLVAEIVEEAGFGVDLSEICEGIRRGVSRDEGVEIGLVVLVKKGCVPRTTSGKVKRWEAKERLINNGGNYKMRVLIEMPFVESALLSKFDLRGGGRKFNGAGTEGVKGEKIPHVSNVSIRPSMFSLMSVPTNYKNITT